MNLKANRPNFIKGLILILIVISFSIPYFFLMVEIKKDVFNIDLYNWLLSISKFFVYSLFAPFIFLLSLSIVKQFKLLARVSALLYIMLYFPALLLILLYYKYFGFIPHYNVLSRVYEGLHIVEQVYSQLLRIQEWIIIILLFVSIGLTFIYLRLPSTRQIKSYMKILMIILVLLIYYGLIEVQNRRHGASEHLTKLGSSAAVLHLGLLPVYKEYILYEISHQTKEAPYPGKVNKNNIRQDNIARFKNANVVIVQVESLDAQAIDYRINGKLVMPFLYKFKNQSVYFKNFFAQHSGGASTDADLSILTSLLPLRSHVGLFTADYSRIYSLVEVLRERGYTSFAMNPIDGQFYNKSSAYPQIGFDYFYDKKFYSGQARGWYSKDWYFYDQSLDIIKDASNPFFAYVINIQSHGPFKNYSDSAKDVFNFEKTAYSKLEIDYLLSMHEIDQALEHFFNKLDELGLLDYTFLLIYGDHVGRALDNPDCLAECVPLFIYHKDLSPSIEAKIGSHLDIAPTILDLLDISEPSGWLGSSLFYKGKKTILFNDLTVIEANHQVLRGNRKIEYQPYLDYSNSIVE